MLSLLIIDPSDFIGGAELFNLDLIKNFNPAEIKVTLVCSGNEQYLKYVDQQKIKVITFPLARLKPINFKNLFHFYQNVQGLKKIIKAVNPDLVQTNSVRAHLCGSLAAKACKRLIIWYLHDYTFPKIFIHYLSKIPAKIIVNSEGVLAFTKNQIAKKYHQKLTVIPNGVSLEDVKTKTKLSLNLKDKYNIPLNCQLVGIIGRLDEWKGQEYFIRAAAKVLAGFPHVRFLIVGDASNHDPKTVQYKKKLIRLITDQNLKKEVFMIGFIPDIYALIKELSILVHCSTEKEPFGRVVLEGMAVGTPVIASDLGGPAEIIEDNVNGMLTAPKDSGILARKILKLLENPDLRQKMVANGFKTIQEKFEFKIVIKKLEEVYKEIISCKS